MALKGRSALTIQMWTNGPLISVRSAAFPLSAYEHAAPRKQGIQIGPLDLQEVLT